MPRSWRARLVPGSPGSTRMDAAAGPAPRPDQPGLAPGGVLACGVRNGKGESSLEPSRQLTVEARVSLAGV